MEILRGYHIKNRKGLAHWDPLLEEWLLAIERYCRIMGGEDAPYWYNERSNIGLLSGAAWRCGRIALEEFQKDKGYSNRKKKNGRADLWIAYDNDEDLIEAKFKWVSLFSKNLTSIVDNTLDSASDDVKKSRGNDKEIKSIAVGFFPMYMKNTHIDEVDSIILEMQKQFLKQDYHAVAWCFPKETRTYTNSKANVLPGIFMVIRNIDY